MRRTFLSATDKDIVLHNIKHKDILLHKDKQEEDD